MKKLWAVIAREYTERVRTRWFVLATVFGPHRVGALMYLPRTWRREAERPMTSLVSDSRRDRHRSRQTRRGGAQWRVVRRHESYGSPARHASNGGGGRDDATRDVIAKRIKGYLVLEPSVFIGKNPRYAGANATSPVRHAADRECGEPRGARPAASHVRRRCR
jgi:ABC-2 type transport system permease protein